MEHYLQLHNIRLLLTPTDYQGGVEVELHPSHMTTGWPGLGTSYLLLQDWREHLTEGAMQHYSHLMILSAGGHLAVFTEAAVHGPSQTICPITSYNLFHHHHFHWFPPQLLLPL